MKEKVLPIAPVKRIIAGVHPSARVADPAAKLLAEYLEDYGEKISTLAIDNATHTGRKTVKAHDIELAIKQYNRMG